jgi:hypothetical protein
MKKTIDWAEAKDLLLKEATETFGAPLFGEYIDSFVDFTRAYSFINLKKLTDWLVKFAENPRFTNVSDKVCEMENATLFSKDTPAWELILQAPENLTAWKYLDTEQNGVVHYAYNYLTATYLEAFFCTKEESSYLHLCEHKGKMQIIPVLFTPEFESFRLAADINGARSIRAYLPREKFQFLSKKSGLHTEQSPKDTVHTYDNGDLL